MGGLRVRIGLAVAIALVGCAPGPVTPPKPTASKLSSRTTGASPASAPTLAASPGPGPLGLAAPPTGGPGGGLVSDAGSGLIGKVKAPTSLISDAGSGLVSDAGSGVVANGGGRYALRAATDQIAFAGARVALLDAAGQPLRDAAGKPLEAFTDALGAFAFAAAPPPVALIVAVDLPGGKGRLEAIVPRADGARRADVDLFSTLVSAYVGERYVRPQADPAGTLAKLPADVEATTRARAAEAFARGDAAVPARLTTADAVATAEKLRAADGAFDGQMEAVRRLLVAAGQLDLGAGLPALEVDLRARILAPAPDGTLYVVSSDARVWRITADGKAVTAAGAGSAARAIDGVPGPQAGLLDLQAAAFDRAGGLLLLERAAGPVQLALLDGKDTRISRLGPDGVIRQLGTPFNGGKLIAPGPDGQVRVLADEAFGGTTLLVLGIAADGTRTQLARLTDAAAAAVAGTAYLFGGGDGKSGFAFEAQAPNQGFTFTPDFQEYRLDGATFMLTRGRAGKVGEFGFDTAGNFFTLDTAAPRKLEVRKADGSTATLLADAPADPMGGLAGFGTAALATDGTAYFQVGRTYRLAGGTLTAIAGLDPKQTAAQADLAIVRPAGLAALAGGDILVADTFAQKVLRQAPDRTGRVVAGDGKPAGVGAEPTGDALQARLLSPTRVQAAPDGSFFVLDNAQTVGYTRIRRVDPAGVMSDFTHSGGARVTQDFVRTADGQFYCSQHEHALDAAGATQGVRKAIIARLDAAGVATDVYVDTEGQPGAAPLFGQPTREFRSLYLALDAQGRLYVAGDGRLRRLTAAGTLELLATDARFSAFGDPMIAIDARGRVIVTDGANSGISRFDPATGAFTPIAGAGTGHLAGTGVDDSLKQPGYPTFDANGDLLVSDVGNRQVKRITAAVLELKD